MNKPSPHELQVYCRYSYVVIKNWKCGNYYDDSGGRG